VPGANATAGEENQANAHRRKHGENQNAEPAWEADETNAAISVAINVAGTGERKESG
jgi:hypothetical protein